MDIAKEIAVINLGRGKEPSRPYKCEDLRHRGLASSWPGFWAEIGGHLGLLTKAVCDVFLWTMPVKRRGCSTASSRPGHQVGRAAVGWKRNTKNEDLLLQAGLKSG